MKNFLLNSIIFDILQMFIHFLAENIAKIDNERIKIFICIEKESKYKNLKKQVKL